MDKSESLQRMLLLMLAERPSSEQNQLIDWLQGIGLPQQEEEEPYLALAKALPMGAIRYEAEVALAAYLAVILYSQPDRTRPGSFPDKLLYNLLILCTAIPFHSTLWEPLCQLHERATKHTLDSAWQEIPLGTALCLAIISQQTDMKFRETWYAMISGQIDPVFGKSPTNGMHGLRLLPRKADDEASRRTWFDSACQGFRLLAAQSRTSGWKTDEVLEGWLRSFENTHPGARLGLRKWVAENILKSP